MATTFIPETPGGSLLIHLEAKTEGAAWDNLLREASHMPYQGIKGFYARGYRINEYNDIDDVREDPQLNIDLPAFTEEDDE